MPVDYAAYRRIKEMSNTYLGCAFLAAQHKRFPKKALQIFDGIERPALAHALYLFGNRKRIVRAYLKQNRYKDHMLSTYLWNPWRDNIDLSKKKQARAKLEKRIKQHVKFLEKYASPTCKKVMVYTLEGSTHNISVRQERMIAAVVKANWPWVTCSNGYYGRVPAQMSEEHGLVTGAASIVSLDGVSIDFPHRVARIAKKISWTNARNWVRNNYGRVQCIYLWQDLWQDLDESNKKHVLARTPQVPTLDIKLVNDLYRSVQQ